MVINIERGQTELSITFVLAKEQLTKSLWNPGMILGS